MLFGKAPVIVLRDGPTILKAVQEMLASAAPGERAGLERAAEIVEAQCARTEDDVLKQWVRGVLADAGVDAGTNHAEAVAALRNVVPDLALTTANDLVTQAA
ncbi:hypothetical protein [Streptomyces sp. NPDC002994]|uniref:hypothetical protein n=1 Tax=Streptomyces sp. NPDC002994 TaxID=3154441 RepID=UPI0033A4249E